MRKPRQTFTRSTCYITADERVTGVRVTDVHVTEGRKQLLLGRAPVGKARRSSWATCDCCPLCIHLCGPKRGKNIPRAPTVLLHWMAHSLLNTPVGTLFNDHLHGETFWNVLTWSNLLHHYLCNAEQPLIKSLGQIASMARTGPRIRNSGSPRWVAETRTLATLCCLLLALLGT